MLFGLATVPALHAYVPSESTQRVPIKWQGSQIPMAFQHNPTDVSANQSAAIVNEVLAQWNAVSPLPITNVSSSFNNFSYSSDARYFGPGVVAVTVLNYDPGKGQVSSGQILVNQTASRGFCLTADKAAANCTTPGAGLMSRVYLGDVVAHEMGHLLGLGHSEVRDSSMLFTTFKGQHTPHPDDIAGVRAIYQRAGYGRLKGKLIGGNNVPVFGGHVQAISTKTGAIAAAALSQEDGTFIIDGLNLDDTFYLYVEPLNHLESLPDAYRSAKKSFCPGDYVGSFFETCGSSGKGHPQPLKLTSAAPSLDVGAFTIRCQVRVGEDYLREKLTAGGGTYEFTATADKPGEAFVGYYPAGDPLPVNAYSSVYADTVNLDLTQLTIPGGSVFLELKLLTTSLGSALDFSVEIDGAYGLYLDPDRPQLAGVPQLVLESGTLRPLYERKLYYPLNNNPALNSVSVKLMPRALSSVEKLQQLPMSSVFTLADRPWLMVASVVRNGQIYYQNSTSAVLDNRGCVDAPYTFAVRANPVSAAAMAGESSETEASEVQSTSCGTWQPPDNGGPGAGPWLATLLFGFAFAVFRPRKSRW